MMMRKIRAYTSPSQTAVCEIAQISDPNMRANVEVLVIGNGMNFWKLQERSDIYFSILDKFLTRLLRRGHVIFWWEAQLLEVISKEEFLSD